MNLLKRLREQKDIRNQENKVREESLEDVGEDEDKRKYNDELSDNRLEDSNEFPGSIRFGGHVKHVKRGFELSHIESNDNNMQVDDIENEDEEVRDIV
jgi:hypothetical protein